MSLHEAAIEIRRRQARRTVLDFTEYTFAKYSANWHHRVLAQALDRWAFGDLRRLMVFMPPQHGKSELVSRRLPPLIHGRRPDARIIGSSYTADLAGRMSRDVQRIMSGSVYGRLFSGTQLPTKGSGLRSQAEFEITDRAGELTGGSYKAAGVNQGITGRPMDYGIIDDPIKGREMAESVAMRQSIWDWYNGDFLSRTHNDTRILLTCTRWHPEDLAGRLLKLQEDEPDADKWEVICFPAVCDAPGRAHDPRAPGEALWPERHSLESLNTKRAASPYDWASLYQQNPRGAGAVEWPANFWGPHIWFDEWPRVLWKAKVVSLDPSKGRSDKTGDYSAFIDLRVDDQLHIWVDADLDNTRTVEAGLGERSICSDGVDFIRRAAPQAILVEDRKSVV